MRNEFIEGEETMVAYKGAVKSVIDGISDGLKSSMSYMNCLNLEELRKTETFAILKQQLIFRTPAKNVEYILEI